MHWSISQRKVSPLRARAFFVSGLSVTLNPPFFFLSFFLLFLFLVPDGSSTQLNSNNFYNTSFAGPICSPLYLLVMAQNCALDVPPDFVFPEAMIVDASTFTKYCAKYSDVIVGLPLNPPVRPTLVVFPSPYYMEVGTLSEPFGNLTLAQGLVEAGDYAFVVVSNGAGVQITENRNSTICVTSGECW